MLAVLHVQVKWNRLSCQGRSFNRRVAVKLGLTLLMALLLVADGTLVVCATRDAIVSEGFVKQLLSTLLVLGEVLRQLM